MEAPQDRLGAFPVPQQLSGVCQSLLCPRVSCSSHAPPGIWWSSDWQHRGAVITKVW